MPPIEPPNDRRRVRSTTSRRTDQPKVIPEKQPDITVESPWNPYGETIINDDYDFKKMHKRELNRRAQAKFQARLKHHCEACNFTPPSSIDHIYQHGELPRKRLVTHTTIDKQRLILCYSCFGLLKRILNLILDKEITPILTYQVKLALLKTELILRTEQFNRLAERYPEIHNSSLIKEQLPIHIKELKEIINQLRKISQ